MSSSYEIDKITNEMLFSKINTPDVTENSGLPFEYLINENKDFNKLIESDMFKNINYSKNMQ